ncbi:hypothetical protein [Haloarchaeobius baliensis]|uniref:hypothetical protein n=1 Tax=Haloarchaeobius baliensis TaxID=1670458 RepID=UPI003F881FCA
MDTVEFLVTKVAPPLSSLLLLVLVYLQFRIQREQYLPDLVIQRAGHYKSVCAATEEYPDPEDVNEDQLLFEVENLGKGKADRVRAESQLTEINSGGQGTGDSSEPLFPELQSSPATLGLDVFRANVHQTPWKDTHEQTIPGEQKETAYFAEIGVKTADSAMNIDDLLQREYPQKSAARLKIWLVYEDTFKTKDYRRRILDIVIFPGLSRDFEEAVLSGIHYPRFLRKNDYDDVILEAKTQLEKHRQNDTD